MEAAFERDVFARFVDQANAIGQFPGADMSKRKSLGQFSFGGVAGAGQDPFGQRDEIQAFIAIRVPEQAGRFGSAKASDRA